MDYNKILLTENDCYKAAQKMKPQGIVVHSTGANNTRISRYVAPDDGRIGKNKYNNHWNRSGAKVCVHAFIGKDKNGVVCTYQTLPLDICAWGVGKGSKGSYNYDPAFLQFEICEDDLTDKRYFESVMREAQELCAKWCIEFNISVKEVVSHAEAHARGYASNHSDIGHWLKKYGLTMDDFRAEVLAIIEKQKAEEAEKETDEAGTVDVQAVRELTAAVNKLGETVNKLCDIILSITEEETDDDAGEAETNPEEVAPVVAIKVGDTVKVNKGAKTYTGDALASFVYDREHTVTELKGDRAVIVYKETTVAAVNVKDLTLCE